MGNSLEHLAETPLSQREESDTATVTQDQLIMEPLAFAEDNTESKEIAEEETSEEDNVDAAKDAINLAALQKMDFATKFDTADAASENETVVKLVLTDSEKGSLAIQNIPGLTITGDAETGIMSLSGSSAAIKQVLSQVLFIPPSTSKADEKDKENVEAKLSFFNRSSQSLELLHTEKISFLSTTSTDTFKLVEKPVSNSSGESPLTRPDAQNNPLEKSFIVSSSASDQEATSNEPDTIIVETTNDISLVLEPITTETIAPVLSENFFSAALAASNSTTPMIAASPFTSGFATNTGSEMGQYLKVTGGDALMTSAQFTIEIDFTADGNPSTSALVSYGASNDFLVFKNGNTISIYWGGPELITYSGIGNALFDGGRHQLSLTVDTNTETFELFVDGVSQGAQTATIDPLSTGGALLFGQEQDSLEGGFEVNQDFEGSYHTIRIFDDIRTSTEVNDGLYSGVSTGEANLQAQWLLGGDDIIGSVVDNTGNGFDIEPKDAESGLVPQSINIFASTSGDDVINGTTGMDSFFGGMGSDTLTGNTGDDIFVFSNVSESQFGSSDIITDIASGDMIDLSAITSIIAFSNFDSFSYNVIPNETLLHDTDTGFAIRFAGDATGLVDATFFDFT